MIMDELTKDELQAQNKFRKFAEKITNPDPSYAIQKASVTREDGSDLLTYSIVVRPRLTTRKQYIVARGHNE